MTSPQVRPAAALLFTLMIMGSTAGCTSSGSEATPNSTTAGATPSGTGTAATPTADPRHIGLKIPDHPADKVDVALKSLALDPGGRTMTLRLVFTPHFTSVKATDDVKLYNLNPGLYMLPTLLDRVHLKQYAVLSGDGPTPWYESKSDVGAPNGQPFEAWFTYSAPQDEVAGGFDVSVLSSWPPFTGVKVQGT